jgi:hypothetical protein
MDPMELLQFLQMQKGGGGNQQQMMADALRRSPQMMGGQGASEYPDMQAPQMMGAAPQGVSASMGPVSEVGRDYGEMDPMAWIDPETGLPPSKLSAYMDKLARKSSGMASNKLQGGDAYATDTGE